MDESEFEQMCRRAYLTYRFPFRSDLKRLMAESLTDASLPELSGLNQFVRALDPRGLDELYYRQVAELISTETPGYVLDYGCGDGRLTEELAGRGIAVTGYDPDNASVSRCLEHGSRAAYGGRDLLEKLLAENARFDTVVCGRVLCTIADNSEFEKVLKDLRGLVADSGTVLVAVCNPFHLPLCRQSCRKNICPTDAGTRTPSHMTRPWSPMGTRGARCTGVTPPTGVPSSTPVSLSMAYPNSKARTPRPFYPHPTTWSFGSHPHQQTDRGSRSWSRRASWNGAHRAAGAATG